MTNNREMAPTRGSPIKPFLFGLLMGGFVVYLTFANIPEQLGLRRQQDVIHIEQIATNATNKLQQCTTRENELNQELKLSHAGNNELKVEKANAEDLLKTETNKMNDYKAQKEELERKAGEATQIITDRDVEITKLKESLKTEQDKVIAQATEIENLKAEKAKQSEQKPPEPVKPAANAA